MLAIASVLAAKGDVDFNLTVRGILTLGAGILILAIPKALNYIVAVYLILIGLGILFDVQGF